MLGSVLVRMALPPLLAASLLPSMAWAESTTDKLEIVGAVPELRGPPDWQELVGLPLVSIRVVSLETVWRQNEVLSRVRVGERFTAELARRAADELLDTGRYADAAAFAELAGGGVSLELRVMPRRIIGEIQLAGGFFPQSEIVAAAGLQEGADITARALRKIPDTLKRWYSARGFPRASVSIGALSTEDPMRVVLTVSIDPGTAAAIARRRFLVHPGPPAAGLASLLEEYGARTGKRADEEALAEADKELAALLQSKGWHDARVTHRRVELGDGRAEVEITCRAGPLYLLRFSGTRHYDAAALRAVLDLEATEDRQPDVLADRIRQFYVERGFLDARVSVSRLDSPNAVISTLQFAVHEGPVVQVVARQYPCLTGPRMAEDIDSEIDSFLSEQLPDTDVFGPVSSAELDGLIGPNQTTGARVEPFEPDPYTTYTPQVYDRAVKHLQSLYRSEGYLSAQVGPVQLIRRRCSRISMPDQCPPLGPRLPAPTQCRADEYGVPEEEPRANPNLDCSPDPGRGIRCEPEVVVSIPIKPGPLARLHSVLFGGNRTFVDSVLRDAAELELGVPVSAADLETTRRRLLDFYAEEGYAFAHVDLELDLSPDHTRAQARFAIAEREQVQVSEVLVLGARRTDEDLIRRRITLEVGRPYRRSLVRETEDQLATLGVFSTVTVGLLDPSVPARHKTVVVQVVERPSQYLDVRPGFSTGEGFRIAFEYGHRNIAGQAIGLTLRSQLGYLPSTFILEDDVREKYDNLRVDQRLERRNSARIEFPEIGLGPRFPFSVEAVDVRDNARDYGLTKDAGIVTLSYRPSRRFTTLLAGSLERNDASIFGAEQKGALQEYVRQNAGTANLFRVPEGPTLAVAERVGLSWDRRDTPLGATKGTLLSASLEHVRAKPLGEQGRAPAPSEDLFAATTSQFLRFTQRVAGYLRLTERGAALAASFSWGMNRQLISGSRTYPDRLFFLGGVDSLRGFLQDSVVPQDIADRLLDPSSGLTLREVVIRGGDVYVNPRLEVRLPLYKTLQTALFVDAGNLWTDPSRIEPLVLRYATGTGLRLPTPVGPLALDYGINVDRALDLAFPERERQRRWEDLGAFHFSIGLF